MLVDPPNRGAAEDATMVLARAWLGIAVKLRKFLAIAWLRGRDWAVNPRRMAIVCCTEV